MHAAKIPPLPNGQEWIRTTEGKCQQIYSLPRLAAPEPARKQECLYLYFFKKSQAKSVDTLPA